jgi:SAM-dependent methyltransferase
MVGIMNNNRDNVKIKKANIRHHDVEAQFFEKAHPEGSSIFERAKVLKSIAFIVENLRAKDVCIDVGCGTGFVTGFELPHFKMVIATDISKGMLWVAKRRFKDAKSLNFLVCDADFLPLRSNVADLVSISSVIHHLPKPFFALNEISRILKKDGFVYITREPSFQRFRRFFDFFDYFVVNRFLKLFDFLRSRSERMELNSRVNGLDYSKVDVHYSTGFHPTQLSEVLLFNGFKILSAYSYHWIYPDSNRDWVHNLLTRSNFLVEKIPLSNRFGRYVSVIARKMASNNF